MFKPGTSIREVNDEVVRIMVVGLVELGVLKVRVDQLLAEQAHRQFFMHRLSHWLGLDVHDVGTTTARRAAIGCWSRAWC